MITKKQWTADGDTTRFLSDYIIRTEQNARVYAYVFDSDGVAGELQNPALPWSYPDNLYIRTTNAPDAIDLVNLQYWDLVNNNISFYTAPLAGTSIWIEVATNSEEFGETLIQPIIAEATLAKDRAETAANRAETSEIAANNSEQQAIASASIATTAASQAQASATTATTQAGIATTKASEASVSASNASTSETNAINSATTATTKASEAASSASSASNSATTATTKASEAGIYRDDAFTFRNEAEVFRNEAEVFASGVTYETLDTNGDIGFGAGQVPQGSDVQSALDLKDDITSVDSKLALKANQATTYTKAEIDTSLANVPKTISKVASSVLVNDSALAIVNDELIITSGVLNTLKGKDANGYDIASRLFTGSLSLAGVSDGTKYIGIEEDDTVVAYDSISVGMYEKQSADDNRLVIDAKDGKIYTTTGGELVADWTQDITGWSTSTAAISVDANNRLIISDTSGSQYGEFFLTIEGGIEYTIRIDAVSLTSGYVRIQGQGVQLYYDYLDGSNTSVKFTALASATISIRVDDASGSATDIAINKLSIYKSQPTLSTEINPTSFIPYPIDVVNETPTIIRYDLDKIPSNIMEDTKVAGDLEVTGELVVDGEKFGQLGVNQTWQDVTASRSVGVTYTNTTGKPIAIGIQSKSTGGITNFQIDGVNVSSSTYESGSTTRGSAFAIVPNGSTYIAVSGGFQAWAELR